MSAPSTSLLLSALLSVSLVTGACGKLKPAAGTDASGTAGAGGGAGGTGGSGGSGDVFVTVSGTAAPHPLNAALGATADFSMLKVSIVDPVAVIADPNATPLGSMTLGTASDNCSATLGCSFTIANVDISNQTLGLVGTLEDTRTGAAREWVKTGTGMGTAEFVASVKAAPAAITNRRAFIVSRALEGKLVTFVNTVLGTTKVAGDLETSGFLIGHVVGVVPADGSTPAGVSGATVVSSGTSATDFDLIYPNDTFTGQGTATASQGLFLVVPKAAKSFVATWTVMKPPGDTRSWDSHLAGTNPNNAFIIIMNANPPAGDGGTDGAADGATDATDGGASDATDAHGDATTDVSIDVAPQDAAVDGAHDAAVDSDASGG
jgi:hypothetical protein